MPQQLTNLDYMEFWDAAAPMAISGLNIREDLKKHIRFTAATTPIHMDAITKHAVMTLAAKVEEDRIDGPITEDQVKVYVEMANIQEEARYGWWDRPLRWNWVRRLACKIIKLDIHEGLRRAVTEERLYIKHYHVTLYPEIDAHGKRRASRVVRSPLSAEGFGRDQA